MQVTLTLKNGCIPRSPSVDISKEYSAKGGLQLLLQFMCIQRRSSPFMNTIYVACFTRHSLIHECIRIMGCPDSANLALNDSTILIASKAGARVIMMHTTADRNVAGPLGCTAVSSLMHGQPKDIGPLTVALPDHTTRTYDLNPVRPSRINKDD